VDLDAFPLRQEMDHHQFAERVLKGIDRRRGMLLEVGEKLHVALAEGLIEALIL
jgi:hypothetical protein